MRGGDSRSCGIVGWIKNSFIDFPGTVSTVLFFSGCNLRCPYCHNPSIVLDAAHNEISYDEIREFLIKRKGVIEGVVFSGGEPSIHQELLDIVNDVRSLGYLVKLDTNGLRPGVIRAVAPDYLALDIKTLPQNYAPLLQCAYKDTKQRLISSIAIAGAMGKKAEIRITVAPGIVDKAVIIELGLLLNGVHKVFLQPMQNKVELLDPEIRDMLPISKNDLEEYREILRKHVDECEIRGAR